MPTPATIEQIVLRVLSRMNEDLPSSERVTWEGSTPIVGDGGLLDSLGMANFLVQVEEAVEDQCGIDLSLTDQDLMELFEESSLTVSAFSSSLCRKLNT
jgi:hypothetical protein